MSNIGVFITAPATQGLLKIQTTHLSKEREVSKVLWTFFLETVPTYSSKVQKSGESFFKGASAADRYA